MIQDMDRKRCRHARRHNSLLRTVECRSNWLIHRDRLNVSQETCAICPYVNRPNRWPMLGEAVASVLGWLGFKKHKGCGCAQRQTALNFWGLRLAIGRLKKR